MIHNVSGPRRGGVLRPYWRSTCGCRYGRNTLGDGPYIFDASSDRLGNSAVLLIVRCENIAEHPFFVAGCIQTFCGPIYEEEIIEIDNGMFAHEIRDQYFEPFVSSF